MRPALKLGTIGYVGIRSAIYPSRLVGGDREDASWTAPTRKRGESELVGALSGLFRAGRVEWMGFVGLFCRRSGGSETRSRT